MFVPRSRALTVTLVATLLIGAGVAIGLLMPRADGAEHANESAATPIGSDGAATTLSGSAVGESGTTPVDPSASRRTAITLAAERVGPSVVTVTVTQVRVVRTGPPAIALNDPHFREFFGQFYPYREYSQRYHSMGSGFLVTHDGYLLTNEHVVKNATEIKVTLNDGREYPASFVGGDETYDVALLKIDGDDLPIAQLGRSDDLIIGEWAIAIGNPFGFLLENSEPTVTAGVVSATRRDIRQSEEQPGVYKDMIQTDAAINQGNSGGPLVNARGEVIGVNTFIFSKTGGSIGIGFAIPIETAKRVMDELIAYGEVRQVWVGVRVQELTPVLAEYLGMPGPTGVIVSFVEPGSPAADAGVRRGDVILAVNGKIVEGIQNARRALFGTKVGDALTLKILREGEQREMSMTLREAKSSG